MYVGGCGCGVCVCTCVHVHVCVWCVCVYMCRSLCVHACQRVFAYVQGALKHACMHTCMSEVLHYFLKHKDLVEHCTNTLHLKHGQVLLAEKTFQQDNTYALQEKRNSKTLHSKAGT